MTPARQLQAYRENQITTTDSCTVLLMLYDGAIAALKRAVSFMVAGDMAAKGQDILRANDIINQFIASLDFAVGGEIAQNLDGLYRYMLDQILLANITNDPAPLSTAIALLSTLKSAWEEVIAAQRGQLAAGGVS
jgi:flagellar protein FliS